MGGVVERIVASLEEAVVIRVAVLWGVFSVSIRVLGGLGAEAYPGKWASATCCECKCGGSCEVGVEGIGKERKWGAKWGSGARDISHGACPRSSALRILRRWVRPGEWQLGATACHAPTDPVLEYLACDQEPQEVVSAFFPRPVFAKQERRRPKSSPREGAARGR